MSSLEYIDQVGISSGITPGKAFSIFLLRDLFGDFVLVEDPADLNTPCMLIDVGGVYRPDDLKFDIKAVKGFNHCPPHNNVPYGVFGVMWLFLGEQYIRRYTYLKCPDLIYKLHGELEDFACYIDSLDCKILPLYPRPSSALFSDVLETVLKCFSMQDLMDRGVDKFFDVIFYSLLEKKYKEGGYDELQRERSNQEK